MSVPVLIKTEDIVVDTNDYNSDEIEDDLQLALEDPGADSYNQQVQQSHQQQTRRNVLTIAQNGDNRVEVFKNSLGPKNSLETEKRMRREIANSNERRRMQSINAGFQNLRALLPRHEGEKLSKAAILQQTSQYILDLEDEKTALLSQNSQLKRILGEHTGDNNCVGGDGNNDINSSKKKRKLTDNVITLQTVSDSSDEGLGSMSPEPTTLLTNIAGGNVLAAAAVIASSKASHLNVAYAGGSPAIPVPRHTAKDVHHELKKELDKERRLRTLAEEELRQIKRQFYIPREVIEHTDNIVRDTEMPAVQYLEIEDVGGNIGHQQVVVCASIDDIPDDGAELISEENIHEEVIMSEETDIKYSDSSVLQPILQAAIKATPKVEVERINETMKIKSEHPNQNPSNNNSIGLTRSRQNLETIVEAIRHLEGDHLFGDVSDLHKHNIQITTQEAPLALTTKQQQQLQMQQHQQQLQTSHHLNSPSLPPHQQQHQQQQQQQQRKTIAELSPFLQIKNAKGVSNNVVTIVNGTSITLAASSAIAVKLGQISNNNNIHNNKNNNNNYNSSSKMLITSSSSSSLSLPEADTVVESTNTMSTAVNSNSSASSAAAGVGAGACGAVPQQQQSNITNTATPTALVKVQTTSSLTTPSQVTITTTALKQCRPGVIVAKQMS